MHKKYKLALFISSIVLIVLAVATTGVSYAVWTSPEGDIGEGTTTVSPSVSANEGYIWAKYFNFDVIEEGESGNYVSVTTFYADGAQAAGLNLQRIVIPQEFWVKTDGTRLYVKDQLKGLVAGVDYKIYVTKSISNQVFMDATLKQLPVSVYIPSGVTNIETGAFWGLANLTTVVFENTQPCTVQAYAFVDCPNLVTVDLSSSVGKITGFKDTSFVNCGINPIP